MTIRKRILLYSALALGAFLAAVYFVSRFSLMNGFSRLESNYAYESVRRLQNHLESEQTQLSTMARDYAQWDRTYEFMAGRNKDYARTELTDDTFNIIHINLVSCCSIAQGIRHSAKKPGLANREKRPRCHSGSVRFQPGPQAKRAFARIAGNQWTSFSARL